MSDDARMPSDAELEAMLDEESDSDFGLPAIDETSRAVLKEWSAQDFANIYTRFRPHLERHARRFLRNQSQVDEVVQDAFLYLMVTLPELDSELGVLRFLKWKTRLLSIDVIRANTRAQISDIDSHPEFESNDPEVSLALEQAEDAAIVRLALSKLNPRHREVLLASMYEEKTSAQIAAQVGLSENATNQLIFRARAAFKKALLGDGVDTTGMSTAKILSVAARKAANDAKKVGAQAMVFVLFLVLAVGAFVSFNRNDGQQQIVADAPTSKPATPAPSASSSEITGDVSATPSPGTSASSPAATVVDVLTPAPSPSGSISPAEFPQSDLVSIAKDAGQSELILDVPAEVGAAAISSRHFVIADDAGIVADFVFNSNSAKPFSKLQISVHGETAEADLFTEPSDFTVTTDTNGADHYVIWGYFSPNGPTKDVDGKSVSLSELYAVKVEVIVNKNGTQTVAPTVKLLNIND